MNLWFPGLNELICSLENVSAECENGIEVIEEPEIFSVELKNGSAEPKKVSIVLLNNPSKPEDNFWVI